MSTEGYAVAPVPDHIPPELVRDFDFRVKKTVGTGTDPIARVYEEIEDYPEIFWTPRNGGHWVARRFNDIREIMRSDAMTSFPAGIPSNGDRPWKLKPFELDPPEHHKFRAILAPLFTPKAIKAMEDTVRAVTVEVIESFARKGECEFVRDFAQRMPTRILMSIVGYPSDDESIDRFLPWVDEFFRGSPAEQAHGGGEILRYVEDFVDKRIAEPADDLISHMVHKVRFDEDGGRAMTRQEVIDMSYQLFVASLDTVPSTFVTAWRFLAEHPEAQKFLCENPDRCDAAAEELMRITGVVSTARHARSDLAIHGVTIRAGESVLLPLSVANRDSAMFPKPTDLVVDREVNAHLTFGAGPHRCIGSHFARAEVRIALEEWLKRIPEFRIKPSSKMRLEASSTVTVMNLPLEWEPLK